MSLQLKERLLQASVALAVLVPSLVSAQSTAPCGANGVPCPVPEPSTWPLVAIAVVAVVAVMRRSRK